MEAEFDNDLRTKIVSTAALFFALQMAAFWGVWYWLGSRSVVSTDALWGVLPLVAIAFFSFVAKPANGSKIASASLILAAVFLAAYAFSYAFAPPMVRAIIAFVSLTFVLSSWRFATTFHAGIFLLFLLSLPLTDSLNFYLGYPMRVVVGEAVVRLLSVQGLDIYREGVCLHFGQQLIWIDAPCSGVKMLWFGTFLTTFLSCLFRLDTIKLLLALAMAFAAIMFGNILRASALFYIEAGLIEAPDWMHSAVGVVAFAITSLAIVFTVKRIAGFKWPKSFLS